MLDKQIEEIKVRQAKKPISQEAFHKWRHSTVTRRLFEDLELGVLESFLESIEADSTDRIATNAMMREGSMHTANWVLEWAPAGVEIKEEEDDGE